MSGTISQTVGKGKTPEDAFNKARQKAFYERGHGGYTGTIAEKEDFSLAIGKPSGLSAIRYASVLSKARPTPGEPIECTKADRWTTYQGGRFYRVVNGPPDGFNKKMGIDYAVFHNKAGPALCIPIEEDDLELNTLYKWLFCGFASS